MKWAVPVASALAIGLSTWAHDASAASSQGAPPQDSTWQAVTTITAATALTYELVMPRTFYTGADAEVTVGWKSRFHVLALVPTLVLAGLTVLNEYALKSAIGQQGPCNAGTGSNPQACDGNDLLSTQSFAASSAFGEGLGVFVVDTIKYSDGKINASALAGKVAVPLVLAVVTGIGRGIGNWEDTQSILISSGVGLVVGAVTGAVYAWLVSPECGYSGNMICW